ncbi:MAG: hypothetical protein AAGA46_01840 [Cyanobacteria bacterium P01_F01_bin.13]
MTPSPLHVAPNTPSRQRRSSSRPSKPTPPLAWIVSTIALATLAVVPQEQLSRLSLALSPQPTQTQSVQPWAFNRTATEPTCQAVLHADQRLSRKQLNQFLSLAEASPQATVHETIAPPYCTLSKAHQAKQQEAYPLAFDPDTWFVVNYDQGAYAGYDFVFQK